MFHTILNILLQLSLAAFALGAPLGEVAASTSGNSWQYGTGGGILGFIVLVLDIIVFIEVLKSNRPPIHKVLWCVVVFVFPIVGMVIYWLFSNRAEHNSRGSYEALP